MNNQSDMFTEQNNLELYIVWDGFPLGEGKCAQNLYVNISRFPYKTYIWKMSEYKIRQNTLDSNCKIIFFGKSTAVFFSRIPNNINWKFDVLGMKYGWTGNVCVITAKGPEIGLNQSKQQAFFELYDSIQKKYPDS